MTESSSHNNKLGFSDFCSSRSRQKESSVATEVRKVRQSRTGLRRLPSAPSCTDQPIAGTLRPQVQEGQEELQLQVSATPTVCPSDIPPSSAGTVFTYFRCLSPGHLSMTSPVSPQGFQLSAAQQEMPLAPLRPFRQRRAAAAQRQLHVV